MTSEYYSASLNLTGRECVVIGGGQVAAAKALALVSAGAGVTVIAPNADETLIASASAGVVTLLRRPYQPGDLRGAFLAVAASGSHEVDAAMRAEASQERCLLNVVDEPRLSDFISPAVVRRGPLQIAVSTSGLAPAVASRVRASLEAEFGDEWGEYVEIAGRVRALARERIPDPEARRAHAESVAGSDLLDRVRRHDRLDAEEVFSEFLPESPNGK